MADLVPNYPRLSKAPIVLAILEIKFHTDAKVKDLSRLKKILKEDFPTQSDRSGAEINIPPNIQTTPISVRSTGVNGYVLISESKKHELFVSADTFTFKQHGAYEDWSSFKKIGLTAWSKCDDVIKASKTTRLSLRYINSIEIPTLNDIVQQEQVFRTFIVSSVSHRTEPISTYNFRFSQMVNEKTQVNFAQELKPGDGKSLPFIVDIDVLRIEDQKKDLALITSTLDELRNLKNKYFFDNLTDSTYNILK